MDAYGVRHEEFGVFPAVSRNTKVEDERESEKTNLECQQTRKCLRKSGLSMQQYEQKN
jgi:hypothetical protein